MHTISSTSYSVLILAPATASAARDVPTNVRTFYNKLRSENSCTHKLQGDFYSQEHGPRSFAYCQDTKSGAIYIHGKPNTDINCDGRQGGPDDDGRCGKSGDKQGQTSFKDMISGYHAGINDLNAKVHPYVVLGNDDTSPSFNQQHYGVQPLSVMAVVCGDGLLTGERGVWVWRDTNGNDRPPLVAEASISLATACYGKANISGEQGHNENDVLYIAFPGYGAVPGAKGTNWMRKATATSRRVLKVLQTS